MHINILFEILHSNVIYINQNQNYLQIQTQVRINRIDKHSMTSLQIKHNLPKYNPQSCLKKKPKTQFKQIQLAEDEVQMLSPQFLSSKTLKKPLSHYGIIITQNNTDLIKPQNDITKKNPIPSNLYFETSKTAEYFNSSLKQTQKLKYTQISLNSTNQIKPAYKPVQQSQISKNITNYENFQFSLDDKNTIFAAMLKKGQKPQKAIIFPQSKKNTQEIKVLDAQKKVGKAESKLKQLFNKNNYNAIAVTQKQIKKNDKRKQNLPEDIEEQIQESFNQYAQEGFENYSGQSAIKQSIKQDLAASSGSGFIKQSIRQQFFNSSNGKNKKSQIIEQIQQSIKASRSAIRQQIPEFIVSSKSSKNNIKEEIQDSFEASRKSEGEVYEQIFQEYEDSLKNSRSAFKKSNVKEKDADILSKSFRKKTSIVKSIKIAQEFNHQNKLQISHQSQKQRQIGSKYLDQLQQEKKQLLRRKNNLSEFLNKKKLPYEVPDKNKNLIFQFRVQLNKLLTSQNFESKLKRLTSFINFGQNDTKNSINVLQNNILKNILDHINTIKKPDLTSDQISQIQAEYDKKLSNMLKDQQISLRVQMDKKLHEKDMQLKKMIAQLEKKFEGKTFGHGNTKFSNFGLNQQSSHLQHSGAYELQSDYSIDSDNISWKADLWEVLPQFQKKKLYEKQTKQVTNFLTQIMINELKEQSLARDLDISFQFPDQFNDSNESHKSSSKLLNLPPLTGKKPESTEDFMPKTAFNRKQFDQNIAVGSSPKKQSIFPDFPRPKQASAPIIQFNKKQSVNQYSKIQGQIVPESTKRLKVEKQKILQILSKYKSSYIRKKNDAIRKILKTIKPKDTKKVPAEILSVIQQITILSKEDINANDIVYVRAYQQQLVWALTNIIMKNQNKKTQTIQEQMRKNYERLVVLCQAKVAQNAEEVVCLNIYEQNKELCRLKSNINQMEIKPCPLQIPLKQDAINLIQQKEKTNIKNQLVDNIINILMSEFAKEIPKRKK